MRDAESIIEELENCFQGHDEYILGLLSELRDSVTNPWIEFKGNEELFNIEARKNCECLFDNGFICKYNDEHPFAIMTHFKRVI